jgi:hypothetical protein
MPTVPRNAPCPCGSGRKHKLCCGTTREQDWATRREAESRGRALQQLFALPALFPLLRPDSEAFEAWLRALAPDEEVTRALIEAGLGVLGRAGRERIVRAPATACPDEWARLVAQVGDPGKARMSLLVGAVVAALDEYPSVDEFVLESLEDDEEPVDPAEAIALCIDPCDLWSVAEASAANEAVLAIPDHVDDDEYELLWEQAFADAAARLLTHAHRRRLRLLVRRVEAQLPFDGFPAASTAVESACAAFDRDKRLHERVAALLLGDTLGPLLRAALTLAA